MFRFPFTNFHELNLDWILSVVKTAQEIFESGQTDIAHAVSTAEQALTVAEQAASATIADGSITTPKLADEAVSTIKMAPYSVTSLRIADSAVETRKIANGAVTLEKLNTDVINYIDDSIIIVNISAYSGSQVRIPATGTNSKITEDHILIDCDFGDNVMQTGDITVTTYDGYLTVSGNVAGTTSLTLALGRAGATI